MHCILLRAYGLLSEINTLLILLVSFHSLGGIINIRNTCLCNATDTPDNKLLVHATQALRVGKSIAS